MDEKKRYRSGMFENQAISSHKTIRFPFFGTDFPAPRWKTKVTIDAVILINKPNEHLFFGDNSKRNFFFFLERIPPKEKVWKGKARKKSKEERVQQRRLFSSFLYKKMWLHETKRRKEWRKQLVTKWTNHIVPHHKPLWIRIILALLFFFFWMESLKIPKPFFVWFFQ